MNELQDMEVVEIRQRVILDAMLDELKLPRSTSQTVANTRWHCHCHCDVLSNKECASEQWTVLMRAIHEAKHVMQKMKQCMKKFNSWSVEKKTPKDYNYFRLQKKKELEACLYHQMTRKDQEIERLTEKVRQAF